MFLRIFKEEYFYDSSDGVTKHNNKNEEQV